ncbi:MAG: type IIL restriction-modification enzyme MmeI, partial [Candidatus Acidiferrales bacterium]
MLSAPPNPNGRPNNDVVVPWVNGSDITGRPRGMWIVDFGTMPEKEAALYEKPFQHVLLEVRPERVRSRTTRSEWWLHERPRPEMRSALSQVERFVITPRVSKHRIFAWQPRGVLPDSATIVFARADDYFIGVLHSRVHELWARAQGTQLREVQSGFRYTPDSTFETFAFPWPPGKEPNDDPRVRNIFVAAKDLVEKRDAWLNPPGASAAELKKRTLTNLYNQHPQWLLDAHQTLDNAVLAAYGWPEGISDPEILEGLLALNQQRAAES